MASLTQDDHDFSAKIRHEKNRFERPEPLHATADSQRWSLRCLYIGCEWTSGPYVSSNEAESVAQAHSDMTGHPVLPECEIKFRGTVVRSRIFTLR